MDMDRRTILSLIAMGRITAAEAERLIAAWNEGRELAWILGACLAFACLGQLHLREFLPTLVHVCSAQVPALARAVHDALGPIMGTVGGLL